MQDLDEPTIHEVRIFAFEKGIPVDEQSRMIRLIIAVKRRISGLKRHEYLLHRQSGKWIEHLAWRSGHEPAGAQRLSSIQAAALIVQIEVQTPLDRLAGDAT